MCCGVGLAEVLGEEEELRLGCGGLGGGVEVGVAGGSLPGYEVHSVAAANEAAAPVLMGVVRT